jgi:hypothetical protein
LIEVFKDFIELAISLLLDIVQSDWVALSAEKTVRIRLVLFEKRNGLLEYHLVILELSQ